jgi:hypothetical protein
MCVGYVQVAVEFHRNINESNSLVAAFGFDLQKKKNLGYV